MPIFFSSFDPASINPRVIQHDRSIRKKPTLGRFRWNIGVEARSWNRRNRHRSSYKYSFTGDFFLLPESAMKPTQRKMRETVKLISTEGFEFVIDREAAMVSQTIRSMLTSPGGFSESKDCVVTFPDISATILEKICQYFYWSLQYSRSVLWRYRVLKHLERQHLLFMLLQKHKNKEEHVCL